MEIKNTMELKLPSLSVNEGFARSVVGAFATQLDPTLEDIADIKTAVSEAVTNAIVRITSYNVCYTKLLRFKTAFGRVYQQSNE